MPLGFSKETVGMHFFSKQWEKWIYETHQKLKKRKDTHAKCTLFIENWIQKNFRSEGAESITGKWEPLSDLTIALRRNKGRDTTKILQDTGALRNQWKRFYTDEEAYLESGINYGWKHENGDPNNTWNGYPAPIPQRKILPVKEQIWPGIKEIYKRFLNKVLR